MSFYDAELAERITQNGINILKAMRENFEEREDYSRDTDEKEESARDMDEKEYNESKKLCDEAEKGREEYRNTAQ